MTNKPLRRVRKSKRRPLARRGEQAVTPELPARVRDAFKAAYRTREDGMPEGAERRGAQPGRRRSDRIVWDALGTWYRTDMLIGWRHDVSQEWKYLETSGHDTLCLFPDDAGQPCGGPIYKDVTPVMWDPTRRGSAHTEHFTENQLLDAGKKPDGLGDDLPLEEVDAT